MLLPAKGEKTAAFEIEVRNVLRKEAGFDIPPGAALESVEARIFQGDTLKTKRMAKL